MYSGEVDKNIVTQFKFLPDLACILEVKYMKNEKKMKTQNAQPADHGNVDFPVLETIKSIPVLLIIAAILISIAVVVFIDLEKLQDISILLVTAIVVFAVIVFFLKLVSEFFTKIIYGRKANWKKDFSLNYANPAAEESELAHALAEKFSLGYLIFVDPLTEKEKKIFLPVDSSFVVGREKSADICINSEYLSKSHFMIRTDRDSIYAVDLNSTNGTKLNHQRIQPGVKTMIADNSDLRAGRINFFINVL